MKIQKNKSLKEYTTFKVGGKTDFFIESKTTKDNIEAVDFARKKKLPLAIIGNGSNILVNDKGFRGVTVRISSKECDIYQNEVTCGTGIMLPELLKAISKKGLGGIEFLWGIPGTLGGAIMGNAGIGKNSIGNYIKSVKIIEKTGNIKNISDDELDFSYRHSNFKKTGEIILEATLELKKTNAERTKIAIKKFVKKRKEQPKGFTAGSIFKNPKNLYAGRLIEKAGLKGEKRGEAQISKKHANFIINLGDASSSDIKYLIKLIQKKVMNKYSVQLQKEICYLEERGWK